MGIEVLALSLPSPASYWERLSSSNQASTRGAIEMGILELGSSNFTPSASLSARFVPRSACTTHVLNQIPEPKMEAWNRSSHLKKSLVDKFYPGWHDPPSSGHRQSFEMHSSASEVVMTSKDKEVSSTLLAGNEKVGVLLLNLGGPEALEDVQPFLFNLFADPEEQMANSVQCIVGVLIDWVFIVWFVLANHFFVVLVFYIMEFDKGLILSKVVVLLADPGGI